MLTNQAATSAVVLPAIQKVYTSLKLNGRGNSRASITKKTRFVETWYDNRKHLNDRKVLMEDFSQAAWNKKRISSSTLAILVSASIILVIVAAGLIAFLLQQTTKNKSDGKNGTSSQNYNTSNPPRPSAPSFNTPADINIRARDTERKTDINSLTNQLEKYYAITGSYPSLQDVNNPAWRITNHFNTGEGDKALADPLHTTTTTLAGTLPSTTTGPYTYQPMPLGCNSATNAKNENLVNTTNLCQSFTLTALLENKDDKQRDMTSTSKQTFYIKRNA